MPDTLTIFIDGLPYDELHKMQFSNRFASKARLIPALGYSVNCQTQLFTGKTADELGFWCEWSYDPKGSPFKSWAAPFALLSLVEPIYAAKRLVHKFIDKLGPVGSTKNIPLRYLSMFDESGHSVFSPSFAHPSLLDHPKLTKFFFHQFSNTERQDEEVFEAAKSYIEGSESPGHVFLTFVKIDACSHWEGVGSPPYDAMLLENDRYIAELTEAFLAKVPDGRVFVVSDHGMSNIHTGVKLELEKNFGKPSRDRYAYFTEGTILRVWVEDENLRTAIAEYVDGIDGLERLSESEREEQGLTDRAFGDLIYHTPEGTQIIPSFWGPKPSVGMHGHHPRYPGQHGICLSTRSGDFGERVGAEDFYHCLSAAMNG
ncbi:MAG: alkaline phosphatase family protein [Deltaproteobacteria bacterium]|nr:alkaline phosphatase family protein [Deltaproteobacteria bacterium]MBW2724496.1 alkaline phosphatase family protein [Deltaproteobacteria bacterium]